MNGRRLLIGNHDKNDKLTRQRASAHASFCRSLAGQTGEGTLRQAILQTAIICEEYVSDLEQRLGHVD